MRILVQYVDFHPDNYQGGSGKSFEFEAMIVIPEEVLACDVWEEIHKQLEKICSNNRPYNSKNEKNKPAIKKVILL